MKKRFTSTFDDLIKNHYGPASRSDVPSNTARIEELFANYYGKAPSRRDERRKAPTVTVLSLSFDDGEILPQSPREKSFEEYVVQQSHADTPFEEYVVPEAALSRSNSVAAWDDVFPGNAISAEHEYSLDVLQPLKQTDAPSSRTAASVAMPRPQANRDRTQRQGGPAQPLPATDEKSQAKAVDDDFAADMQAILTGQSVYDPVSKTTRAKSELDRRPGAAGATDSLNPPTSDAKSQTIFDRIAQSMEYANAYDLGTVELTNRFADFDKLADLQEQAEDKKKSNKHPASAVGPSSAAPVDSEDFIRDLDAIRHRPAGPEYTQGREFQAAQSFTTADETLSEARKKLLMECWPLVKGAKYKGNAEEKNKWNRLLPGVDIEDEMQKHPGYTTCGVLPLFLLKNLGGIEDPGILSGGLGGVRDGLDLKQKTTDLNFARKMFGPYVWLDDKGNIFKGGAKNLGVWVPHDGANRPKPGDIYLLEGNISKAGQPPMIGLRHIGVIVHATKGDGTQTEIWHTADAGQGRGADQQCLEQSRAYDPADRTVTGTADKGTVIGWVDLDLLVQKSAEMKAAAGTPSAEDIYS